MNLVQAVVLLFKESGEHWAKDKCPMLAAALAYYTSLSLAPILVISVGVASLVFGERAVEGQLVGQLEGVVGSEIALAIERIIESAAAVNRSGVVATIAGVLLLLVAASGVFNQLTTALNMIWGIAPKPERGVLQFIKARFLSLGMVIGIGFLLSASVASSIALAALRRYLSDISPAVVSSLPRFDIVATLLVITVLFAVIFRVLPDAMVNWRDVWLGAAVTALLFALGEFLIGLYLAYSSVGSAYGAAGSLVVILTWIYYSALIILYGAEFTKVYANTFGSKIRPAQNAHLVYLQPVEHREIPDRPPSPDTLDEFLIPSNEAPSRERLRQVAAAFLGIALGLLLAFIGSLRRKR